MGKSKVIELRKYVWNVNVLTVSGVGQINAPKWVSSWVYLTLGWALLPHVKEVAAAMGPISSTLLLAGGLCYSVGAIIYAAKYPDPVPKVCCLQLHVHFTPCLHVLCSKRAVFAIHLSRPRIWCSPLIYF